MDELVELVHPLLDRRGRAGGMRVVVSRKDWGGPNKTGHVVVAIGPITIGDDKQPHVVKPTKVVGSTSTARRNA